MPTISSVTRSVNWCLRFQELIGLLRGLTGSALYALRHNIHARDAMYGVFCAILNPRKTNLKSAATDDFSGARQNKYVVVVISAEQKFSGTMNLYLFRALSVLSSKLQTVPHYVAIFGEYVRAFYHKLYGRSQSLGGTRYLYRAQTHMGVSYVLLNGIRNLLLHKKYVPDVLFLVFTRYIRAGKKKVQLFALRLAHTIKHSLYFPIRTQVRDTFREFFLDFYTGSLRLLVLLFILYEYLITTVFLDTIVEQKYCLLDARFLGLHTVYKNLKGVIVASKQFLLALIKQSINSFLLNVYGVVVSRSEIFFTYQQDTTSRKTLLE